MKKGAGWESFLEFNEVATASLYKYNYVGNPSVHVYCIASRRDKARAEHPRTSVHSRNLCSAPRSG